MWPAPFAAGFVSGRIQQHRDALARAALGEELPLCTDDERWLRQSTYAVKKAGNKRATKVFDHKPAALEFAAAKGLVVEERPAEPIRCTTYCKVSAWCSQYAAWKKESGNDR